MAALARSHWVLLIGLVAACRRPEPETVAPAVARLLASPDQLLWGPTATGAIGDIVLENGLIQAVVTRDAAHSGFGVSEGNLVDIAPLPDGADEINEVFLYLNDDFPRQARYGRVEIASRGGKDRAAIVRATGTDTTDQRIMIETDYILQRGQHWITLETRFTSTATAPIKDYEIGDAVQWGRTEHLAPGHGFDLPGRRLRAPWIAGIGAESSYALVPDGNVSFETMSGSMWSDPIGTSVDLYPRKTFRYRRHVVVGRGDTASLAEAISHLRGDQTGRLTGRVTAGEVPITDAKVWILDQDDRMAGLAKVDREGWYSIRLLPGSYHARVEAPGRTSVHRKDQVAAVIADETATLNFTMGAVGVVRWRLRGDDGRAPPVKVTIVGRDGTPTPRFGPSFRADGAENHVLSPRGVGEIPLAPGQYRVLISRGTEYELVSADIEVRPGERLDVEGTMVRSVSSPKLISTDLHQHSSPSFDSGVSLPDRAISNAAEGVEVLVSSEHNALTDFRPVIASLGLGRVVQSVVGTEATTHSVGHFNAFPLRIQPGRPLGGMVDPEGMSPRQIFDLLRGMGEPEVPVFLQVNHPRSNRTGYLDLMGFDPDRGSARNRHYAADYDGLEIITFGYADETQRALADWFALLRAGHRITATGTSDSHTISLRPVGWPRTFVCVEEDDPPRLDVPDLTAALRRGCATISAGPLVVLRAGEVQMGGLLPADADGQFEVTVEVQAPSWIPTERLILFLNGQPALTVPLVDSGVLRYRGRHRFRCERDCFLVAWVEASTSLAPVLDERPGMIPRPVGLTNPIYVDVDRDGRYDPGEGLR